jgi:hypothetical protein
MVKLRALVNLRTCIATHLGTKLSSKLVPHFNSSISLQSSPTSHESSHQTDKSMCKIAQQMSNLSLLLHTQTN